MPAFKHPLLVNPLIWVLISRCPPLPVNSPYIIRTSPHLQVSFIVTEGLTRVIIFPPSRDETSLCCLTCPTPYMTKEELWTPAALMSQCLFFHQLAFPLTSLWFIQISSLRYFNHIPCAWVSVCNWISSSETTVPWDPPGLQTDQTTELWCIEDLSWYLNFNKQNWDVLTATCLSCV